LLLVLGIIHFTFGTKMLEKYTSSYRKANEIAVGRIGKLTVRKDV